MKRILFIFGMLLSLGVFGACSSSDNNDTKPEEPEKVVLDADTLQVFDGFDLKFQMLDDKGRPVTKFKEGENFTFKVVVTNKQKDTFGLPSDFLGNDAFHIFSANGADLGKPWDAIGCWGTAYYFLPQSESAVVSCKAFGKSSEEIPFQTKVSLVKYKDRDPLPKGSYYTEFELALNAKGEIPGEGTKGIVCKKAFTIE